VSGWDLTDDDVLLAALRDVIDHADPAPPEAIATAMAAFDMFRVDDELAILVADSLSDTALLVRQDPPPDRMLTFTAAEVSLEVELAVDGGTVYGAIVPPTSALVEIETASATMTTRSDALGRFRAEVVEPGRCRLRVRAPHASIVTPWIIR